MDQQTKDPELLNECERALALNPNLANAHSLIGLAKLVNSHPEQTEGHELEALCIRRSVLGFDGAFLSSDSKDALWARFFMGAPPRLWRSVERYSIVKRA